VRWVDVDLPDILRYKTEMLAGERPRMPYEAIHADLRDAAIRQALLTQLASSARQALVITEGLLIYLTAEQVGALARDLHAQRTLRWWAFDIVSPRVIAYIEKSWGKILRAANAPFQFGPAESTAFFKPFGWKELEFRSMIMEAQRIHRPMPMSWLWRLMARFAPPAGREEFRRSSGMAVLERD
jgi:O-methyltransferase involved in polyketide biosynthesis